MLKTAPWRFLILLVLLGGAGFIAASPTTRSAKNKKPSPELQMSPEGIMRIRQALLRPEDTIAQFKFEHDVRRRFTTATDRPFDDFVAEPPLQQALEILRQDNPALSADVRVLTDPPAMVEFKNQVLPMIIAGCATAGCHGGTGVGDFYLSYRVGDSAEVYADFDVLRRYVKVIDNDKNALFADTVRHWMIDTENPEKSLLLQYALPAMLAQMPHKQVRLWQPLAIDKTSPRYLELLKWIESF